MPVGNRHITPWRDTCHHYLPFCVCISWPVYIYMYIYSVPQERHDGNSNGNPRLPHLPAVSQHLYSPSPSLSHSASSDFQPPYFPPPYQPISYPQSGDPYSHLGDPFNINSIHQSQSSNQQHWPGRQAQEGLGGHGRSGLASQILGLDGSSGVRREGFRRPELLSPHVHSIESSVIGDSMGMHDMGHGLEEVQVSGSNWCAYFQWRYRRWGVWRSLVHVRDLLAETGSQIS